jgi:hypothetical protein
MSKEKFVLVMDSSQLDTFDTCPQMWYYQYHEGLMQVNARPNVPMDMGTYGHKLLELYYKSISREFNPVKAMNYALKFDFDKEICHCGHNQDKHDLIEFGPCCETIGCTCQQFEPIEFPLNLQQRNQVKERFIEYCMIQGTSIPNLVPHSPNHVEVGFSKKLYEDNERLFILEGRVDLIGQIANNVEKGWADHKFQTREKDLYLKSIQFRNYSLVLELSIGVVNYVRLAKKFEVGKTFKRDVISFSKLEIDWWRDRVIQMFFNVERAIKLAAWDSETDQNHRRSACSGKYGYECYYTPMCNQAFNPAFVQIIKETDFKQKPIWRPW